MLEQIVNPLLSWYDGHARILPWREKKSPYRVWVSEIMLQQTRVEAVKPFFERFVEKLPNVQALAECSEDELLKLWEGLGYYNRVRNMQRTAKILWEEYGGEFPTDLKKLLELPGIGNYTAGAVRSIAFNLPAPAVDGNVLRVLSRVLASDKDVLNPSVKHSMEQEVEKIIPKDRAGDFNQALMEIGAMICVPNGKAKCGECPLAFCCQAKAQGIVDELPKKKAKKARRLEDKTVLVLREGNRVAIRKRPSKGLLAGLYEFPNLSGHLSEKDVLLQVKQWGFSPLRILPLGNAKHIFSHVEWHMTGYMIVLDETEKIGNQEELFFIDVDEKKEKYSIPSAFAAYVKMVIE